jgi:hypothetical protein
LQTPLLFLAQLILHQRRRQAGAEGDVPVVAVEGGRWISRESEEVLGRFDREIAGMVCLETEGLSGRGQGAGAEARRAAEIQGKLGLRR